ncbi:C39 family peptidase [Streptomyces sp. NPDC059578]|uniref:C39 family peptidase n=1 Tax=Streptomyces sp. NPDC059578 TaxID=3346874 RepID=UPI00368C81E5
MTAPEGTSRRTVLTAACAAVTATTAAADPRPAPRAAVPAGPVAHHGWTSCADWARGTARGTRVVDASHPRLAIDAPTGVTERTDPRTGRSTTWEHAVWTGPEQALAVAASEVIPSWNAHTPPGTWLRVELRGTYADGSRTPWYLMGDWAAGDRDVTRTSKNGQGDGRTAVRTDTLAVTDPGTRLVACRARLTLYRTPGSRPGPLVRRLGLTVSDLPDRFTVPPAPPALPGVHRELRVPRYAQTVHAGRYPEYDNGGEAWCSPASSQMVLEYWGRRPTARDLAWVDPAYDDPQVCHAARATYDHAYGGCGNWSFNAAYAASYPQMTAVVTRFTSLGALEGLIAAGIPVITSLSFRAEELTGAGYGTPGHLMVVVGFTAGGEVIAHDPSSPSNAEVRRVYRRREWENAWLRTRRYGGTGQELTGSGGVGYLFVPTGDGQRRRALAALGIR